MRPSCGFDTLDNEHSVTEHSILENPTSKTTGVIWEGGKEGEKFPTIYFLPKNRVFGY
jgi:hypothetical protein